MEACLGRRDAIEERTSLFWQPGFSDRNGKILRVFLEKLECHQPLAAQPGDIKGATVVILMLGLLR